MNKRLFIVIFIFLSFFKMLNVKAATTYDYGTLYNSLNERGFIYKTGNIEVDMQPLFEELATVLKENNLNYSINIYNYSISSASTTVFSFSITEYNSAESNLTYKLGTSSISVNFSNVEKIFIDSFSAKTNDEFINRFYELVNYIKVNKSFPDSKLNYWLISKSTEPFMTSPLRFNESNIEYGHVIYDSNVDLKISSITGFDSFKIKDSFYQKGSSLLNYKEYIPESNEGTDELGTYIRIPLSELYDSSLSKWKDWHRFFRVKNKDLTYNFKIYYEQEVSNLPQFPFSVYINNNLLDPKDYADKLANGSLSDANGYGGSMSIGGGSFGGGSGGGRFDSCTFEDPLKYSSSLNSTSTYGVLILSTSCSDLSNKLPTDFRTKAIRVYYDSLLYETVDDAIDDSMDDYFENLPEDSPLSSFVQPFINLINSKLPIIEQFKNIFLAFQDYKKNPNPPEWSINLEPLGFDTVVYMDFSLFEKYRDTIFFIIKLSATYVTFKKLLKIVADYFD